MPQSPPITLPPTDSFLKLFLSILSLAPSLLTTLLRQRLSALHHRLITYHPPTINPSPTTSSPTSQKTIAIIGGSFAGVALAERLSESLPSGWRVVLIERNSHFHYLFAFPRFSVLAGHERKAFIPYGFVCKAAPRGVFSFVRGDVACVAKGEDENGGYVELTTGERVEYAYLAVATGSWQPAPAKVSSTERGEGCRELRMTQRSVRRAHKIAVVGAGAVGVEMAADIKSFYPDKDVTLVHSRERILSQFGARLHEYVVAVLERVLGVRVLLSERPQLGGMESVAHNKTLTFSKGREEAFDLVIACTGQRPNSGILSSFIPGAISKTTSRILVTPTLQIKVDDNDDNGVSSLVPSNVARIYALGDVAEHSGPRMARASRLQADVVCDNIVASIKHDQRQQKHTTTTATISSSTSSSLDPNPPTLTAYTPRIEIEGALTLTLGKERTVMYVMRDDGSDLLVAANNGKLDMNVGWAWRMFGADIKEAESVGDDDDEEEEEEEGEGVR